MFKSFNITDRDTDHNLMLVEIIDDDFISDKIETHHIADAIIKCYKQKHLNVAINIIKYIIYLYRGILPKNGDYIREAIIAYKEAVPELNEYNEEFDKYFLLL